MKIIFCLASLGSGGAERVVSLLANRMAELGHEIEIICLKYDDVYYKTNSHVKITLANSYAGNPVSKLVWLRKYIKVQHPDVVIPFTEGVYCFTICALLGCNIPVIASERLDPQAMAWQRKMLKAILLPYAAWLVVQTEHIKKAFPTHIQRKTSIILNPVNAQVLTSCKAKHNIKFEKQNSIISVARLFPQKNQRMMIEAFSRIADQFPDWKLIIYGDGPLKEQLTSQVRELNLEDRVLLPGRTEHVAEELQKSEIFCLSSDYEGMSNSMIEAICMGLPIVTTRVSGTEELIKDGNNGFIVNINDAEGMAKAFARLMTDEELRLRMGEVNKKKAQLFHIENIVTQWLELVERVSK